MANDIKALLPILKVNDASIIETLTPLNLSIPASISGSVQYYKKGSRVSVFIDLSGMNQNVTVNLGSPLPQGYRPYKTFAIAGNARGTSVCNILFYSNGGIQFTTPTGYARTYIEFDAFN